MTDLDQNVADEQELPELIPFIEGEFGSGDGNEIDDAGDGATDAPKRASGLWTTIYSIKARNPPSYSTINELKMRVVAVMRAQGWSNPTVTTGGARATKGGLAGAVRFVDSPVQGFLWCNVSVGGTGNFRQACESLTSGVLNLQN